MTVNALIEALMKLREQGHGDKRVFATHIKWGEPTDGDVEDIYPDRDDYGRDAVRVSID